MSELFIPSRIAPMDGNGDTYPGFTYEFFDAGTDAAKTVYAIVRNMSGKWYDVADDKAFETFAV